MEPQTVVLLVQTAALGFAGGKLWQLVHALHKEIQNVRQWKHDDVTPRLFKVDELWRIHEQKGEV